MLALCVPVANECTCTAMPVTATAVRDNDCADSAATETAAREVTVVSRRFMQLRSRRCRRTGWTDTLSPALVPCQAGPNVRHRDQRHQEAGARRAPALGSALPRHH